MNDPNSITLVNQLCESYLPTGNVPGAGAVKKLKTRVISQLFKPTHNSDVSVDDFKEPRSLLKTDILCQAVKNHQNGVNGNINVDKMFNTIDQLVQECDPDVQRNIFLFIHELCKLNENKEITSKNKTCKIPVNENNKLFSNIIRYEDLDWSTFYKAPASISTACIDYPFHEEPGEGISFFREHISDFKFPSSNGFLDLSYKVWRFDLNRQVDPIAQDEGFVTPGSEFSGGNSINDESEPYCSDKLSELDISGCISNEPIKRAWHRLGNDEAFNELPFSSESIDSVIHLWKIANSCRIPGMKYVPIGVQVSFEELIVDLKYLLFGVASHSFYFNEEIKLFQICDRLHTATLSPELLTGVCRDLLMCANHFYFLKTFAEERLRLAYGSIHYTFCKCIQQILNMYRYCLLKIEWQKIKCLSNLQTLILPLRRKLTFLAEFCWISIDEKNPGVKFPSGVQLLDYLYGNLTRIYDSELGYMLFYMFETCCNAYLRIVSEWIFDGCFSNPDNYAEFFIEIRREFEICRDWRRVSCIGMRNHKIPKFLDKFFKEIFVCGKSLNLLKICSSKQILDNLVEKNHPNLICCFNQNQMNDYEVSWRKYKASFEEHFGGKMNIKEKLLRKCDNPDFYAEINSIREKWFREKEIDEKFKNTDMNPIQIENIEEKSSKMDSISETKITQVPSKATEEDITETETPTNLNPQPSPNLPDPLIPEKANVTISFTSTEPSSEKDLKDITIPQTPQTPSFSQGAGDYVENSENQRVKHLISLIEQKSKPEKTTPIKSPNRNFGAGDASTPGSAKVLKDIGNVTVPSEYTRNRLKAMSTSISSPIEENIAKFSKSTPLSACQENKLRVMSSEYHIRLNDSLNTSHEMPKPKPTILTACQENKLKVMSSEYHNRLSTPYQEEPVKQKGKLSICDENKLRVMTSEYQVRLNESFDLNQKHMKSEPEKPVVLSALQENKLKVMSSEYHHRLSMPNVCEETPKQQRPMSASEENKLKVMSSEYHIRLQNNTKQEENLEMKAEPKELTECQKNKLKIMSSEYHCRMNHDAEAPKEMMKEQQQKLTQDDTLTLSVNGLDNLSKITEESIEESQHQDDLESPAKRVQLEETLEPKYKHLFDNHLENFNLLSIESVDINAISDVDTASLEYYLAQSIAVPLRIQMKLVNEAILRVFIEEEHYLDHLTSLRDYLLLRKPEFTVSFTNSIFKLVEKVKKPYMLMNNYTLSSILQRALLATGTKETITFGKKLSFFAEGEIPESFTLVDIKELDCLTLNYTIKWPNNILITEPIMKKYCKIFKFLLQIQRILWVLKRDFISLKNLKLGKSIQYMKIQLFRHNMTQVMKIFQEYVMREALETCWNDFVEQLTNTEIDLDLLYMSHLRYINKTLQRCFLCELSSPCRESILNMFSVILKYHEALKAGVWKRNVEVNFLYHTNFKNIDSIYGEFVKHLNLVRVNLRGLVYEKQKTYFESLYLELSKNAEE